jgi:hypothetical protein
MLMVNDHLTIEQVGRHFLFVYYDIHRCCLFVGSVQILFQGFIK